VEYSQQRTIDSYAIEERRRGGEEKRNMEGEGG